MTQVHTTMELIIRINVDQNAHQFKDIINGHRELWKEVI